MNGSSLRSDMMVIGGDAYDAKGFGRVGPYLPRTGHTRTSNINGRYVAALTAQERCAHQWGYQYVQERGAQW